MPWQLRAGAELIDMEFVDFRTEAIDVLTRIGDAVPRAVELRYHLCYGSPQDEHMVLPKDAGLMVEMVNAVSASVQRPIQFFHLPVSKPRTDEAFYMPLVKLKLKPETELYLGLIHRDDEAGNAARLAAGKRHAKVDGIGTECGMARGDPATFPALLARTRSWRTRPPSNKKSLVFAWTTRLSQAMIGDDTSANMSRRNRNLSAAFVSATRRRSPRTDILLVRSTPR